MPTRTAASILALAAACALALAPVHEAGAHARMAAAVDVPTGETGGWIESWHDATPHVPWLTMARPVRRCFVVDRLTLQPCADTARRASGLRIAVVPMVSRSRLGLAVLGRF
jgi:hypothetical protein